MSWAMYPGTLEHTIHTDVHVSGASWHETRPQPWTWTQASLATQNTQLPLFTCNWVICLQNRSLYILTMSYSLSPFELLLQNSIDWWLRNNNYFSQSEGRKFKIMMLSWF